LLADKRVDPSIPNNLPILNAVQKDNYEMVDKLLNDVRVNVNHTVLINAGHCGINIISRLLKDPRINPTINNNNFIIMFASRGRLDVVNLLLADSRVNPADQHNKAIFSTAINGHARIVQRLLEDPRVDPTDLDNRAIKEAIAKRASVCLRYTPNLDQTINILMSDPRVNATFHI
jgi:hypothetical protein